MMMGTEDKSKPLDNQKNNENSTSSSFTKPRVIYNGEDRTPLSLYNLSPSIPGNTYASQHQTVNDYKYNTCSVEDVLHLKFDAMNSLSLPAPYKENFISIPWLDGSNEKNSCKLITATLCRCTQKNVLFFFNLISEFLNNR